MFFSLEIILGEFTSASFTYLVVASVAASVVARAFSGAAPAFVVPEYALVSPGELVFYLILGVLAAIVARLFVRLLYYSEDVFEDMKTLPEWARPALGGLFVGAIGLFYPQVFGVGYEAATHAPITAVVILFEMTRDYRIILPLLISVAVAMVVCHSPQQEQHLHAQTAPARH